MSVSFLLCDYLKVHLVRMGNGFMPEKSDRTSQQKQSDRSDIRT